jgi:hypothetical protein
MALDKGANGGVHAEKTRDEEQTPTPDATPTGSQAQVHDHNDGTIQSTEADSPAADEKRSITGLKVCWHHHEYPTGLHIAVSALILTFSSSGSSPTALFSRRFFSSPWTVQL